VLRPRFDVTKTADIPLPIEDDGREHELYKEREELKRLKLVAEKKKSEIEKSENNEKPGIKKSEKTGIFEKNESSGKTGVSEKTEFSSTEYNAFESSEKVKVAIALALDGFINDVTQSDNSDTFIEISGHGGEDGEGKGESE
jgi:hypothetical protein